MNVIVFVVMFLSLSMRPDELVGSSLWLETFTLFQLTEANCFLIRDILKGYCIVLQNC